MAGVTNEEEEAARKQIAEEGKEKKEQIKKDIDKEVSKKDEKSFIDTVVDTLISEGEEYKIKVYKAEKEAALYKQEYDKLHTELNELRNDASRVSLDNKLIPIVNTLQSYLKNREDKDLQFQAVQ